MSQNSDFFVLPTLSFCKWSVNISWSYSFVYIFYLCSITHANNRSRYMCLQNGCIYAWRYLFLYPDSYVSAVFSAISSDYILDILCCPAVFLYSQLFLISWMFLQNRDQRKGLIQGLTEINEVININANKKQSVKRLPKCLCICFSFLVFLNDSN